MAAARRQEASDARKAVQAALTDQYQTAPEIAAATGVKEANVYYHCKRLVEEGVTENKLGKGGGYRVRQVTLARMARAADAMTEADRAHYLEDEDAPATTTGAAPDASPEPPADPPAPSPSHTGESAAAGPVPFAGVDPREYPAPAWATVKVGRARMSVVGLLAAYEDLTPDDRARFDACHRVLYGEDDVKGAGQ